MYSPFQLGTRYLSYYLLASNGRGHGIHSPFVYSFIREVLNDDRHFYAYNNIEDLRQQLIHDTREIWIEDFVAGVHEKKMNSRKVADIAVSSLKTKKFGQLLFRMVDYYSPDTIVVLGTSLGINTAYLAAAKAASHVITLEGASAAAALAQRHFHELQLDNISIIEGDFDDGLSDAIEKAGPVDLAFIDGNRDYEAMLRYFYQLLPATHSGSILIFEGIHRGREMEQVWKEIKAHPDVTLTIDLFFIGIVLFRKENKAKQHFKIRF